jgi:hypothetical protein
MSFFNTQNPGIGGLDELTDAEALFVQNMASLGDPGADRLLFWDDSAGQFAYLTVGSGLTITDTTISASSGSIDGSGTTNELVYWVDSDTLGALAVATYPSLTELAYVKGVTSAIQTQLNAKAPINSPTFTGTVTLPTWLTGVLRADSGVVSVDTDVTDLVSAASESAAGKIEVATNAEIDTGTDTGRAMSPDQFAGSNRGKRIIQVKVFDDATAATTGDGKAIFFVPVELNGMNLVDVEAYVTGVSSSGALTVMIRNITQAADMLSTAITIDQSENSSLTAATAPVIDTNNDDVATGDLIAIDVDGAGSSAEGLGVVMSFQTP